jgi:NADH dehydrogenase/NADH:ubiquinone oxidoreductase subunit G
MATATDTAVSTLTLSIDGRTVTVPVGTTVWEAARELGIEIPVLCHTPRLDPVGVCRMCVVDVGERVLAASCVRACREGMQVQTESPKVEKHRAMLTRLLLSDHPSPCAREQSTGDCELEALGRRYGLLPGARMATPSRGKHFWIAGRSSGGPRRGRRIARRP